MIVDRLENMDCYKDLGPRIAVALQALRSGDFNHRPDGRYELPGVAGQDVYALVQSYPTKLHELGKWEAHHTYLDVQYVVEGIEVMGYAPLTNMRETVPYNAEKDVAFYAGQGDLVRIRAGMVALFYPQDVHMPGLCDGVPTPVKKIVIKIRVA